MHSLHGKHAMFLVLYERKKVSHMGLKQYESEKNQIE